MEITDHSSAFLEEIHLSIENSKKGKSKNLSIIPAALAIIKSGSDINEVE